MQIIERGTPEEASYLAIAQQVGDALMRHYPNHPWIVSFQGGALVVRHQMIAYAVEVEIGRRGFSSLLPHNKLGTPKEITAAAIRFGGELLELFNLPRGAWDGRMPEVPASWKWKQQKGWA